MAISLGSIVVELLANTGGFITGMDKAGYAAKKVTKEIHQSFDQMGSAGTIVPSVPNSAMKVSQTKVEMHIHGVTDMDSFKRSQTQISNAMGGAVNRAASRVR
jgi:hypothetical protein